MSDSEHKPTDQQLRDFIADSLIPEDIENAHTDAEIDALLDREVPSEINTRQIMERAATFRAKTTTTSVHPFRKWIPAGLTAAIAATVVGGLFLMKQFTGKEPATVVQSPVAGVPLTKPSAPPKEALKVISKANEKVASEVNEMVAEPAFKNELAVETDAAQMRGTENLQTTLSKKSPARALSVTPERSHPLPVASSAPPPQTLKSKHSARTKKIIPRKQGIDPIFGLADSVRSKINEAEQLEANGDIDGARKVYQQLLDTFEPGAGQEAMRKEILLRLKALGGE